VLPERRGVGISQDPYAEHVPENTIPQSPGWNPRPGQTLHLTSLAPLFDGDRHQLYYDLLVRAIDTEGPRNVALTGAYGTGKSSVLAQLGRDRASRVVELSLSTIASSHHGASAKESNLPAEGGSRTNQIQKEIVKQLLYRLPPGAVPRSRFRRTSAPNNFRDWRNASLVGGSAFAVALGLGLLQPLVEALLPMLWRQVIAYALFLPLSVGAAWAVMNLIRSRPMMSASVQTGVATVTLSKQSDTYFDEYLDEIVYFFQVSQRDIVIIEDIDRFEDVQVFDTLRALNGLLNSSEQIGRRIVFIYAIRDSVFEQIGAVRDDDSDKTIPTAGDSDRAKATLERANRTKFFDVIIPVVPFVSADNARDVLSEVMASDDFTINPALIRLAARHVADMRMIHNIRNEFEVYRSRLIVPKDHIPEINDDLVFAVVLFKNTHLADFEKIRHRGSTLDQLYSIWRTMVRENIGQRTLELAEHRHSRHLEATKEARAARLGQRLMEFRDTLESAARATAPQATATLSGPATDANVEDPGTWLEIATEDMQMIRLQDPITYRQPTIDLSFSAEQLTHLLGTSVSADEWEAVDLQDLNAKIKKAETDLQILRHHTWEDLCAHPEFRVNTEPLELRDRSGNAIAEPLPFKDLVEAVLESDLARDLVQHGFLTSHFALYASSYYGNHLGPEAMEYIRRCIEPGTPDASFTMSEADVVQLLREQGAEKSDTAELFGDASVFNVSILDYLLSKRPAAAATVARRLALLGEQEQEFLDTYVAQGEHAGALLAAIAAHWTGVVQYAAVTAPVDPSTRPALLNAVLSALPSDKYDVDREVGQVLESSYRNVDAIVRPTSPDQAGIVMRVVRASGAFLESLAPLNEAALNVAVELRLYPITEENLRVLVPTGVIALEILRDDTNAYGHVLDRFEDYLALVDASPRKIQTVTDPKMFAQVLTDAARRLDASWLGQLIDRSGADCRVTNLDEVTPKAWPFLAATTRTDPTFENTSAYLEHLGMDDHIGTLLDTHKKITDAERWPEESRRELAVTVLAASKQIPSTATRVRLAASVAPGMIEATSLTPEKGDLVARLIKRRLLADDPAAFSDDLMVDWATLEATIAASKKYATFVSSDLLDASNIPNLLRSSAILQETKLAVVSEIGAYVAETSRRQVVAVAGALVETGWKLPYESLDALRAGGATAGQIISLIAATSDKLPTNQLKALLQALGGDYARVANGGQGRPTFNVTQAHEYMLSRLINDTVKRVEAKEFKRKGRRLVAPLLRVAH